MSVGVAAGVADAGCVAGGGDVSGAGCATADTDKNTLTPNAARAGIDVRESDRDHDEVRIGAAACHTPAGPAFGNRSRCAGFLGLYDSSCHTRVCRTGYASSGGVSRPASVVNADRSPTVPRRLRKTATGKPHRPKALARRIGQLSTTRETISRTIAHGCTRSARITYVATTALCGPDVNSLPKAGSLLQ